MSAVRKSNGPYPAIKKPKTKSHSPLTLKTTLTVVDKSKPSTLHVDNEQGESYYLCTRHTDGFHKVQSRFLLAIADQEDFKREFETHFHGYIKIGKKGRNGHVLKSSTGSTLAVVSKISRNEYDVIQSYLESSDLSLLHG